MILYPGHARETTWLCIINIIIIIIIINITVIIIIIMCSYSPGPGDRPQEVKAATRRCPWGQWSIYIFSQVLHSESPSAIHLKSINV